MATTKKDLQNAFERFCEVFNIANDSNIKEEQNYFLHLNYNKVTKTYQVNYIGKSTYCHYNNGIGSIFANKSYKAKELINQFYALIDAFYYLKSLEN